MSHVSTARCPDGPDRCSIRTRSVVAQTRLVSKAEPLARDAVTHDWTAFLGPTHNAISTETRLSRRLPPPLVWELTKGTGYGSPAIAGRAARVPPSAGRRKRSSSACTRRRARPMAIPLPHRFRRSIRLQQRPAIESGHRRRARLHGGRAGAAALPRPRNRKLIWKRDLDQASIASVRIFSARRRRP